MAKIFPSDLQPTEETRDRLPFMQRGASQLLFNYLPYRTVDWEDGLAIVQLGAVRFSSMWEEERKATLLNEIDDAFARWTRRGGRVDSAFPDRKLELDRFTIGMPETIEAAVLDSALICQRCGQLIFESRSNSTAMACPNCHERRLHQIPFVFVHGCGEMVPIQQWLPATKKNPTTGELEPTKHPIRCKECSSSDNLYIPDRSDRVKDMKILCRKCKIEALDRLTARCHRCLKRLVREQAVRAPSEQGMTIVQAIAMRLARYSASDAYYPYSLSVLRLDRPKLNSGEDDASSILYRMLPPNIRPDAQFSAPESIKALSERLSMAQSMGDAGEVSRLLGRIAEIATGKQQQQPQSNAHAFLETVSQELEKGIKESLAFRTTVTFLPAEEKAEREGGQSHLLRNEVESLKASLGINELLYVEDLPIISATVGFTRRDFNPTYEELGAQNLPVEIRAFPALQKTTAQRLGRPGVVGTIPIPAREGEHEGIYISLNPEQVITWLDRNGVILPHPELPEIARIMQGLESIDHDRYYDSIWQLPFRRLIFGLIHSFSHAAMRAITRYAGIDRTSVAEYIFLPMLGFVVYDSSSAFKLGGIATLVRDHLASFLQSIADEAVECLYDPDCADHTGACHGCLHSPEISCRVFNHGLSRSFLIGGHAPWADVSSNVTLRGYWEDTGTK